LTARRLLSALVAHGLVGVLAPIGLLWLFLGIADEIPERGTLVRIDDAVARWLEAHGTEAGETVFFWISQLGSTLLAVLVVAAILWLAWHRERRDAIALAIVSSGGFLLGTALKMIFHRGRPETATEFITRQSWSFPSGHALNSVVSYGFLTMLVLERIPDGRTRVTVAAAAAILIGTIGFSRLYLGVHYLSDVLGGWIAGAAWLIVSVSAYRYTTQRL
jgi:undecaprenyl-diphosphatase